MKPSKKVDRVLGGFTPLKKAIFPTLGSSLSFSKFVDYLGATAAKNPKLWINRQLNFWSTDAYRGSPPYANEEEEYDGEDDNHDWQWC